MELNNLFFYSNIIVFDEYFLNPEKDCINIESINSTENIKFIDFFKENKIEIYNKFMKRAIFRFPIIRIFGATLLGQKCCINIHNYYPYFFIEINEMNYFNYEDENILRKFAYLLENSYIQYLNDLTEKYANFNKYNYKPNQNNIPTQIIHNITIEKKTNIYGYYNSLSTFLKIECYNSKDIKGLMTLLSGKVIMEKIFQCFDAHISYCTHFFGDFNLFGMGLIKLKNISFRYKIPNNSFIDFINSVTKFNNNIIWDIKNEKLSNIKNEEKQFILHNNEYMVWDDYMIKEMNYDIQYNNFNKSSKSEIEIDCVCENIIIIKNELSENENHDNSIDNNKQVDISNLKNHIKHCTSLINLWKEEIERREKFNIEKLIFEKISDQNFFELTENYLITHKEITEKLLKMNFIITNSNENQIKNNNESINEMMINSEQITKILNIKDIDSKKYEHSYALYKKKYINSLYDSTLNLTREYGININDNNSINSEEDSNYLNKEEIEEQEQMELDLSCFNSSRTLNEQSFNNQSRKLLKEILTNKTVEECYLKEPKILEEEEDDNINQDNFNNKYNLLANKSRNKIIKSDNKKNKEDNFYKIFNNLYLFHFSEKNINRKKISLKLIKNNYHYDNLINPNLNDLFYSNHFDYKNFYFINYQMNKNIQINNQNSLKTMMNKINKIRLDFREIHSHSINRRNKLIINEIEKLKLKQESEFSEIDENDQLFFFDKYSLIFIPKNGKRIKKGDVIKRIKDKKEYYKNKKEYDINYFKNLLYKEEDLPKIENMSLNETIIYNQVDKTIIHQKYENEISPITEKKYISNYDSSSLNFLGIIESSQKNEKLSILNNIKQLEKSSCMTILSVEVFANSESNLLFNYNNEEILSIFISIHDFNAKSNYFIFNNEYNYYNLIITSYSNKNIAKRYNYSKFILSPEYFSYSKNNYDKSNMIEIIFAKDEIGILKKFSEIVIKYDPDIITGFETELLSIGYIVNRGRILGIPLNLILSRINNGLDKTFTEEFMRNASYQSKFEIKIESLRDYSDPKKINYLKNKLGNKSKIKGRIILNLWRVLEKELKLNDYSFENIIFHSFDIREPKIEYLEMKKYYNSKIRKNIIFIFSYYQQRSKYNLLLLKKYDIINRCCQFVKIYGIDFESSLTRGSQYRVEGVLSKLAKSKNYTLLSATRQQLLNQSSPKFTPIVLEPPKNFYYNPVIVLDFQSLYPSIMIGYNICFSTCLGKLQDKKIDFGNDNNEKYKKLGVYKYNKNIYEMLKKDFEKSKFYNKDESNIEKQENNFFEFLKENTFTSPNRILYIKKNIKEGLLPIILKELLLTRIMIKKSMKKYNENSTIYSFLNNRQLGIKGLANVIYGYTSAGFSGRMPNTDIGDTIVSLGRKIVNSSINYIENESNINCKVIYSDTDSMFISLYNKSPEEAILIGKKIANEITKRNPEPIKLQFEKVYCPLVFNSKKHYAGYKFESEDDVINNKINLDTKGMENVRRDTCNAIRKIIEKMIKILFDKRDLSILKNYLYKCFDKIISGDIIFKDFIFSREVKFGKYKGDNLPPSAQVANQLHQKDKNFYALYKQRVPYVIYNNQNGEKTLKNSVISIEEFFSKNNYTIYYDYYITLILKMIDRFLGPLGIDVELWYKYYNKPNDSGRNKYYYKSDNYNYLSKKVISQIKNNDEIQISNFLKSSYALKGQNKSPSIDDYMSNKNTKNEVKNNDIIRNNCNDIIYNYKNNNKSFHYIDKINNIIEECFENEIEGITDNLNENFDYDENKIQEMKDKYYKRKEKLKMIIEYKKRINLLKRKNTLQKICRYCSSFSKFNLDIEEIPCINYQCKIFYEKRIVQNELDIINQK